MPHNQWMVAPLYLIIAASFAGCNTQQSASRDQLWRQNQELQQEVIRARMQADAAAAERDRQQQNATELQRLLEEERARQAALVKVSAPAPVASNKGLSAIEGIEVIQTRGAITVRVPGDILFAPGQVTLKSTALKTLDRVASELKRSYAGNVIRVEGYTDQDKIRKSKWKDNLELSLQRAASVHRHLQSRGMSAKKMYAAGFGATKLQSTKAKSRRVEIVVVSNP